MVSSINGTWKIGQLNVKERNEHSLAPYKKVHSYWIKDLIKKPDTIKLLEGNIGRTLFDINHSNILLDPFPKVKEIKEKVNKGNLIKFKSFCVAKETINKMKNQSTEWEKYLQIELAQFFSNKIYSWP